MLIFQTHILFIHSNAILYSISEYSSTSSTYCEIPTRFSTICLYHPKYHPLVLYGLKTLTVTLVPENDNEVVSQDVAESKATSHLSNISPP